MVNSTDFAKRLEKIFNFYGLSATEFASEMDFNRSTISHILSGRNKPSLEFVMKLLQKFPEVKLNWLMNGKGNFPSTDPESDSKIPLKKQSETSVKSPELFAEKTKQAEKETFENTEASSKIERIVIFYKDGSFKVYQN